MNGDLDVMLKLPTSNGFERSALLVRRTVCSRCGNAFGKSKLVGVDACLIYGIENFGVELNIRTIVKESLHIDE